MQTIPFLFLENKVLSLSLSCASIIGLINIIFHLLADKSIDYYPYDMFRALPFFIATQFSTLLVFMFYYLDNNCTNNAWKLLEKREVMCESEPPCENDFILRKINSHSSVAQFFVGLYIICQLNNDTRLYLTSFLFGFVIMVLGIISYLWWSSSSIYINKLDNWLMETHVNGLTTLFLGITFPKYEYLILVFWIINVIELYKKSVYSDLVFYSVIALCSSIIPVYFHNTYADVETFNLGCLLTLGGLIPKTLDRCYGNIYGTGFFHLMEAFGFLMFYNWVQTFPLLENN